MNRSREARPRRHNITTEDRARVLVEFDADNTKPRWLIQIEAPHSQHTLPDRVVIYTPGTRSEAVRTAASIAAALWQTGRVPAQLLVRNKKTGQWGEERTYPDVTPRRRG